MVYPVWYIFLRFLWIVSNIRLFVLKEGQEVQVKVIGNKDGKISLSMKALLQEKEQEEEVHVEIPEAEEIGTSMGDLLKNSNFS